MRRAPRLLACATLAGAAPACAVLALFAACKPELGSAPSRIDGVRVLAVRGEPPEAARGQTIHYDVLVATPEGTDLTPHLDWAFCATPTRLTESSSVSSACLHDGTVPIAVDAPDVTAPTPRDACHLFGPDTQSAMLRPRPPDVTGGYFQPVRVQLTGLTAFGFERVTCDLANASIDVARDFAGLYHANQNPRLEPLTATVDGVAVPLDQLPAGQRVQFSIGWPADAVESFPVLDSTTQVLVPHRESMVVSWFATAGDFASDRTGRGEDDPATTTSNDWTAPTTAGPVHSWVVLRDSRGGVDFASYPLTVAP